MFKPHTNIIKANPEILQELSRYRQFRNFDPCQYLDIKARLINQYFKQHKISEAVIGISGGIDSVTSLYILQYAKLLPNSPIQNIHAIGFVAKDGVYGTTGNGQIKDTLDELNIPVININNCVGAIINVICCATNHPSTLWSSGQTTAHLRTTILAGMVSNLSGQNKPALMIGTTNKDEYSYIGYFGKYSDGLNDLQIISDLHKSEVYKLAQFLNVPEQIITRVPTGDMYVECSDEEVFGVDYDCIEYYTQTQYKIVCENWYEIYQRISDLNFINKHKYAVGTPTVCLDILESGYKGGKELNLSDRYYNYLTQRGDFISNRFVNPVLVDDINQINLRGFNRDGNVIESGDITIIENCINDKFINTINDIFVTNVETFVHHAGDNGYITYDPTQIESKRVSLYNVKLADAIWTLIKLNCNRWKFITGSDVHALYPMVQNETWIPVGINPLLRMIEYKGGKLVPHYDYPFTDVCYDRDNQTLMSVVIYIDCHEEDGTIFYEDPQQNMLWKDRITTDKIDDKQLTRKFKIGKTGDIVIFPHHLLHGSLPTIDNRRKLIIRTDIMFESALHDKV